MTKTSVVILKEEQLIFRGTNVPSLTHHHIRIESALGLQQTGELPGGVVPCKSDGGARRTFHFRGLA